MAGRSGIDTQVGIAEETTYGTLVAPARFLEFTAESLKAAIDRNESKGKRAAQRVIRSDHWKAGKRQGGGGLEFEIGNKGLGLLLTKHLLGSVTTTADGAGKKHSGSVADLFGKSLTIQIGRPDVSGVVQPFSYLGCKIDEWEISNNVDGFATLKLSKIDARDEDSTTGLTSATAPAADEILHWSGAVITLGGSAFDVFDFSVKGSNKLKSDRFYMKGSNLKKEPIEKAMRDYTGSFSADFDGLTAYQRFLNGTHAAITATWTAVSTYDVAKPYKLVITIPSARFDGETPNSDGEDTLRQSLPFKAHDAGAGAITIDYYTSDATP